MKLRVMTFNIHHGVGTDGRLDLARIAAVVRDQEPDVVGLQEVDRRVGERSAHADQASWLARSLRMTGRYGPAMATGAGEYGNAVLVAGEVVAWDWAPLPVTDSTETRNVLTSRLGAGCRVWVTHLSHDSPATRIEQARALLARYRSRPEPTVLLGDFNAAPDEPCVAELGAEFVDVWAALHAAEPGLTFSTSSPRRRIDYVLASRDVAATRVAVVDAGASSDHHAVVADLELP